MTFRRSPSGELDLDEPSGFAVACWHAALRPALAVLRACAWESSSPALTPGLLARVDLSTPPSLTVSPCAPSPDKRARSHPPQPDPDLHMAVYQLSFVDFGAGQAFGSGVMCLAAVRADLSRALSTEGSVPEAAYIAMSAEASRVACAKPRHQSRP